MTIRRSTLTILAFVTTVVLAGCSAPDAPTPTSATSHGTATTTAPSPSATSGKPEPTTPSSTPTESAAAAGPPPLESLLLSTDGLSYVDIGKKVPTTPTAEQIVEWTDTPCSSNEPGYSAWVSAYDTPTEIPFGIFAAGSATPATRSSPIGLIYVQSDRIRTAHDLGVGSTIGELKKVGATKSTTFSNGDDGYLMDSWVVHGSNGELVFWVWEGTDAMATHYDFVSGEVAFELVQQKNTKPYFPYELDNCS